MNESKQGRKRSKISFIITGKNHTKNYVNKTKSIDKVKQKG